MSVTSTLPAIFYFRVDTVSQRKMGNEIFLCVVCLRIWKECSKNIWERRLFQSCYSFKYWFNEIFCLVDSPYVQAAFLPHTFLWSVVCCCLVAKSCQPLLWPHGLCSLHRLLCPWDFSDKNTGVGCNFLLQGFFPTQGWNPHVSHLLHGQADSLPRNHQGREALSEVCLRQQESCRDRFSSSSWSCT